MVETRFIAKPRGAPKQMQPGKQHSKTAEQRGVPDPADLAPALLARRQRIIDVALELLDTQEYEEIQIREVAEHANVALATLYRYFTSKEHLYAAALVQWGTGFELPAGVLAAAESDEQRIRVLLQRAIRAFERRPQILRAEIALEGTNDPNARALFDQFASRYNQVMLGQLTDVSADTARTIVNVVDSVLGSMLKAWALGRHPLAEVRRSVDRAVTIVFHGSAPPTEAGHKES